MKLQRKDDDLRQSIKKLLYQKEVNLEKGGLTENLENRMGILMFSIDGIEFDIPLVSLKREVSVLDKYANKIENGALQREIIGVYYNYTLIFPSLSLDTSEYASLWDKVTGPVEFRGFVVPSTKGSYSFKGYITVSGDMLRRSNNCKNY